MKRLVKLVLAALAPLLAAAGDPARGAAVGDPTRGLDVVTRQSSTCVLCHAGPWPNPHLHGSIGPALDGVGARLTPGELHQRIAVGDGVGIMPSFGAVPTTRVGAAWAGRPILSDAEIADAVAYLSTLRKP